MRMLGTRALLVVLLAMACRSASAAVMCGGFNTSLSFGNYISGGNVPADSQAVFQVRCTSNGGAANASVTVGLGPSATSGLTHVRQMTGGSAGDLLEYNLYRDASLLSVWGNTAGVDTVTQSLQLGNGRSGVLDFTIFGRIAAGQDVHAGRYSDQILISVDF